MGLSCPPFEFVSGCCPRGAARARGRLLFYLLTRRRVPKSTIAEDGVGVRRRRARIDPDAYLSLSLHRPGFSGARRGQGVRIDLVHGECLRQTSPVRCASRCRDRSGVWQWQRVGRTLQVAGARPHPGAGACAWAKVDACGCGGGCCGPMASPRQAVVPLWGQRKTDLGYLSLRPHCRQNSQWR